MNKNFQSHSFRIGRMVESMELFWGENREQGYTVDWEGEEIGDNRKTFEGAPVKSNTFQTEVKKPQLVTPLLSAEQKSDSKLDSGSSPRRYMGVNVAVEWEDKEIGDNRKTFDGEPVKSKTVQTEVKRQSKPQLVTPLLSAERKTESKLDLGCSPRRYMGINVAKEFVAGVFVGRVTDIKYADHSENSTSLAGKSEKDLYYHIEYEDGDCEDFDHEELKEGITLFLRLPKRRRIKFGGNANKVKAPAMTSSFQPLYNKIAPIHTLILGTYPARNSLNENQYFATSTNAFWWIAGDCLGFRRGVGEKTNGEFMKLCADLRYDESHVIPYKDQVSILCRHGFALWDIIASCNREGSLDSSIQNDKPNDIQEFVRKNPTIRNIVFANGKSSLSFFDRHFRDWWRSGALVLQDTGGTSSHFECNNPSDRTGVINCICAPSVSPAASTMTYREKRDLWDTFVYTPGLKLHRQLSMKLKVLPIRNNDGRTTTSDLNIQSTFPPTLLNKGGRIGMYLPEARKHRIARFHVKRQMRIWRQRIEHDVRKKNADSRPRYKGKFVQNCEMAVDLIEL